MYQNVDDRVSVSDRVNDRVNDGVNDGVNDEVSETAKTILVKIVKIINSRQGVKTSEIATEINKSEPTVRRYIKILVDIGIVEFKGAYKTGGYFLTFKSVNLLKQLSNL